MSARRARLLTVPLLAVSLLAGCAAQPVAETTQLPLVTIGLPSPGASSLPTPGVTPSPGPSSTASPSATNTSSSPPTPSTIPLSTPPPSPTVPPPTPLPSGAPTQGCVNGWASPAPGTPLYQEALSILAAQMGQQGPWNVAEMRYFTGPDVPWIQPGYDVVERWYVKASRADDAGFQGRWLIEKRTDQIEGISAVAPWYTAGYRSPDWTGFEGEGPPVTYLGLPGQWAGVPYDFVTGAGDGGQPGLPTQVSDCLKGT